MLVQASETRSHGQAHYYGNMNENLPGLRLSNAGEEEPGEGITNAELEV